MKKLCEKLATYVSDQFPGAVSVPVDSADLVIAMRWCEGGTIANHMLWMLKEIPSLPSKKANRWLGFVQGWLTAFFGVTVDQCREDVREWSAPAPAVEQLYAVKDLTTPDSPNISWVCEISSGWDWCGKDERAELPRADAVALLRRVKKEWGQPQLVLVKVRTPRAS